MKKIILTSIILLAFSALADAQSANKVIAHRGAWKADSLPQNSLASFKRAVEMGCAGSEFDVYQTKDGVLVLNHDNDLDGYIVEKCTLAELQQKKLSNGETICPLEDIIKETVKQKNTLAVLEIKTSVISKEYGFSTVDKVLDLVHKYGAEDMMMYISFDYSYLRRINEKCPTAKTAYLGSDVPLEKIVADKQFGIDYHYNLFKKDTNLIAEAHKNGINVNVWTVNKEKELQYFLDQGVDYITTNEPGMLLNMEKNK